MVKKVMLLGVVGIFALSLNGCVTMRKNNDLEVQGLRNQVLALEAQLREKDNEINNLKESPVKFNEEVTVTEVVQASPKDIQTALKNAGFYKGAIDGKLGKGTRRATRKFQRANNLPADGKVGKNTWDLLKEYLNKKIK
ncbi:MAG: peptidoglycan-binding domain-containing protein [Candidatus Omnitrophota bacterium]